jgi:GT2 family glycosyltransferase
VTGSTEYLPFCSVILVNYNGKAFLDRTLASLRSQTYRQFETILVDNASTDGSLEYLESRSLDLTVVRLSTNRGFAAANNIGVRVSRGEWIALLNNDAFPQNDWLETLFRATRRHPEYSFFASCLLLAPALNKIDGLGDVYHFSGLAWRQGHGHPVDRLIPEPVEVFGPCGAAALYRRDIFLAAGGFDEDYFCYHEDVDLAFRLRLRGQRCLYLPDAVVGHLASATHGAASDFVRYHSHRNLVWTFVKNMPSFLFYFFLPAHLLLNLGSLLFFSFQGQGKTIWKSKRDAVSALPRVWLQRKKIQQQRQIGLKQVLMMLRFKISR